MLKFSSKSVNEHAEVPLADDGRWEDLVDTWKVHSSDGEGAIPSGHYGHQRPVYVVSLVPHTWQKTGRRASAQLAEILSLVGSQGDHVVGSETVQVHLGGAANLAQANPRTCLGKGTAEAVAQRARDVGAKMLVVDTELSPSQTRNLEDEVRLPVCDREAVILNVFLRNARTRRARIQVEVAQLAFLRPRIRGVGLDMDQQMGGMAGARGPGETASELLARKLDSRMAELKKALSKLSTSAKTQRRGRADCARVALVGYTNAGKTSVINALTGSDLSAKDRPFETLDTTSRSLTRHGGDVVVSDTVGFVRRLPEGLLASFESTLEEVAEADLLVLVVDASDPEARLHVETTVGVLERIGADRVPRFFYFNKLDRDVPEGQRACSALAGNASWFCGSTSDIGAMNELRSRILHAVRGREETRTFDVPYQASKALSLLYARCRVLETEALATALRLRVEGPAAVLSLVERALHEVTR